MLTKLTITRFKSIREQVLDLGRVNLFIGGNGTGKSNLLEAIGMASACLGRGLGDTDLGQKGLRISPPELMKSSFKNEDLPKTLALKAEFSGNIIYKCVLQSRVGDPLLRFFSESSEYNGRKIFGRSNRGARATGVTHAHRLEQNRGIWDQIKATYDIDDAVDKEFQQFSRFVIYTPQTDFLRGRQKGRVDTPPVGLHGEGLPEAASSLLQVWRRHRIAAAKTPLAKSVDDQILQIGRALVGLPGWTSIFGAHVAPASLVSRDIADPAGKLVYFIDKYMHTDRNRLSAYDSSEGTLFLLFVAIILSHPDSPKIFALDNVDNALNPKITKHLVESIIKISQISNYSDSAIGAKQVFLTSHNPTSLDAFDLFDEDFRVFVVSRNEKGYTKAERLVPPKEMSKLDWEIAKGGRNLSQLWLDGDIPGALGEI